MDPYEVLGVSRGASEEDIEDAYREKVKQYHPDVSDEDNATEKFKQIKRAYDSISNGKKSDSYPESKPTEETKKDQGRGNEEEVTESEDGEVVKTYRTGWKLAYENQNGNYKWFVFSEAETSPHADESAEFFLYIDDGSSMTYEPFYFDTRSEAEESYQRFAGPDNIGKDESGTETPTGTRSTSSDGQSNRKERGAKWAEQREDSFKADSMWGGTQVEKYLDEMWKLCYQRGSSGKRRWGIRGSGAKEGTKRYLNDKGKQQTKPFWFQDREKAEEVYEEYIGSKPDVSASKAKRRNAPYAHQNNDTSTEPQQKKVNVASALGNLRGRFGRYKKSWVKPYVPRAVTSVLSNIWGKVYFVLFVLFAPVYMFVNLIIQSVLSSKKFLFRLSLTYILFSVGLYIYTGNLSVSLTSSLILIVLIVALSILIILLSLPVEKYQNR